MIFDRDRLLAAVGGDLGSAAELVEMFLDDSTHRFAALERAVGSGDREALRAAAHALRGSSESIRGPRTAEAARRLEALATGGDLSAAPELLEDLAQELAQLHAALRALESLE